MNGVTILDAKKTPIIVDFHEKQILWNNYLSCILHCFYDGDTGFNISAPAKIQFSNALGKCKSLLSTI